MKHTPLTALAILALALVGCGSTQANDEPQTAEDDYLGYLTTDQQEAATEEQLNEYNNCMSDQDQFAQDYGEEFNGIDAHYNCEPFIADTSQPELPDLTEEDWNNIREINECYDQLREDMPELQQDLPQEAVLEDPTLVYQHPTVQEHCM